MTELDDANTDSGLTFQEIPWRRIANVAGLVLLVAIVLPFVIYAVPQVVGADHSYVVLSGSMEPTMSPGDVVIVNSVAASNIEKGDVITFRKGGEARPTTHRVIEVTQQGGSLAFKTKGDANEDADTSLVTPDEVQGRVMSIGGYLFVIPYMGYVINFINTQLGFVLLFAVPITLLVLNEVWNVIVAARTSQDSGDQAESDATQADTSDGDGADADVAGADASTTDPDKVGTGAAADAADSVVEDVEVEGNTEVTESDESSDAGITFSAAELQLGLVVLAAFLAYSIWVAYKTLDIWAFGVTGGVGASFLLLAALYIFGGSSTDTADTGTPDTGVSGSESSGPEPDSSPAAANGGSNTDEESVDSPRSAEVDPDVELNLLDDVVGQRMEEDAEPTVGSIEQHLSDGGSLPDAGEYQSDTSGGKGRSTDADDNTNGGEKDD